MKLYEQIYDIGRMIFLVLYIVTILGVWSNAPHYLERMDDIFKIFVGCILIYLCSPWSEKIISSHHKEIIFEAGIMLILSSSLGTFLRNMPVIKKVFL